MIEGLRKTYKSVRSANGPAQMLSYSFWGVLIAGMFEGICEVCITPNMLLTWGTISLLIVPATIWLDRKFLLALLLADLVMSAWILVIFILHEPNVIQPIYYTMGANGMTSAFRPTMEHKVSEWFHSASLVWMIFHALYLADLTNRQILEKKRFQNEL